MPPRQSEYLNHFPVGVWFSGATVDLPVSGGGTSTITPDDAAGTIAMLHPNNSGYKPNHMTYPFFYASTPAVQEDTQFVSDKFDAAGLYHVVGPTGRTGPDGTTTMAALWNNQASSYWTAANAAAIAGPIVTNYEDHPTLLGYNLGDDVTQSDGDSVAVTVMAQAFQDADPYDRPAFFVHVFPNAGNLWDDYDCKVTLTYRYPCGKKQDGSDTEEGNFMSYRLSDSTDVYANASHVDWVDAIRWWKAYKPAAARDWWVLQTHNTTTGTANLRLRQPTDRELRKQFWIAVGEGIKGIYWFRGDNITADSTSDGVFDDGRKSSLGVLGELSQRLKNPIRTQLLSSDRVTDLFTASGGGASFAGGYSYTNAYISTLLHTDGTYYVVVCNNDTSTQSVTINSATKVGKLVNMETGTTIRVGGSMSLPALDGTIFKYVADVGVPEWEPDHGIKTVETWWSTHWANPSSANYVATVETHPTEVVVAAGELQDLLDAHIAAGNPPTTYRLAAGNHPYVVTTGLSHAHFIPDTGTRPVWYGHLAFGSAEAEWYNTFGALKGFSAKVGTDLDATALAAWNNPQSDLIYRDIDFRPAPGTLVEYKYFNRGGVWNTDHHTRNSALFFRNYKDILVEGCTSQDFIQGTADTNPTVTGSDTTYNSSGSLPVWNSAHVAGNSGIQNVVVRDCDFMGTTNASRGFPCAVFFDGGHGTVTHDIRLTGKWSNGYQILMTNGDYTADVKKRGNITREFQRDAHCNVMSQWSCDQSVYGQVNGFAITGSNNLIKSCDVNTPGGSLTFFAEFSAKAPLDSLIAKGFFYESYHNIVDDCDITAGGCTLFVQHDPNLGILPAPNQAVTNPRRSQVGQTTIKNSHVKGTIITGWIGDKSGATAATITPHVETSNTTG